MFVCSIQDEQGLEWQWIRAKCAQNPCQMDETFSRCLLHLSWFIYLAFQGWFVMGDDELLKHEKVMIWCVCVNKGGCLVKGHRVTANCGCEKCSAGKAPLHHHRSRGKMEVPTWVCLLLS